MENPKKYRVIPRQSELAVRITGVSQADLFASSALALFEIMANIDAVESKETLTLEVDGTDRDELLVNWMRELLYLYQGSGYLLKEFIIQEAKDTKVKAEVHGEKIDPDRHEIKQEINAVADHHGLMQQTGNQWTAQMIFEV